MCVEYIGKGPKIEIALYDEIDRAFTDEDRRILIRVAGYMAQVAVIANEEPLRETSLTDPTT